MANVTGREALDNLLARRVARGFSVSDLAKAARVSDWTIRQLEAGGTATNVECIAIVAALGDSLATCGQRVS